MPILAVLIIALIASADDKAPLGAIEKCDGSGTIHIGSQRSDGQEWFTLEGKVVDANGVPVCGAEVSARYSEPLETAHGSLQGATSPTGLSGEFVLANLRKGRSFTVVVNPFHKVEYAIGRARVRVLADVLKTERNARASGVARYRSEQLSHTAPAGAMRLDIILPTDAEATGMILGDISVGLPLDIEHPATARIIVTGREPIDVPVRRHSGKFVALGIPPGAHRVEVDVTTKQRRYKLTGTAVVHPGDRSVTKMRLRPS